MTLLANPWVGGFSLILALLGVALSIYLYQVNKRERDLTYYVNPIRTIVLKKDEASGLRVLHDGEEIRSDITAVQIGVWNRGKQPIRSVDILSEVQIVTKPPTRILEASVRKLTRPVTGLTLDTTHLVEGKLPISWRILEQNDGGSIQLLLAGPAEIALTVDGIIEGQSRISTVRGRLKSPALEVESPVPRTQILTLIGSLIGMFVLFFLLEIIFPRLRIQPTRLRVSFIFAILAAAILVLWFTGGLPQGPPFEL